jgi:hypothetical protein
VIWACSRAWYDFENGSLTEGDSVNSKLVGLLGLLCACVPAPYVVAPQYTLRRVYHAEVAATPSGRAELEVRGAGDFAYSETFSYRAVYETTMSVIPESYTRDELVPGLAIMITNPTESIVTIDWDHSAIVDSQGSSYKVVLASERQLPQNIESVKKPPAPVLAPRSFIRVEVFPEISERRRPLQYLPVAVDQCVTYRLVLSTVGGALNHSEALLRVTVKDIETSRDGDRAWPGAGEKCLPRRLGCAEGFVCKGNRCMAPVP